MTSTTHYANPARTHDDSKISTVVVLYLIGVVAPIEFFLGTVSLTPLRVLLLAMVIPMTVGLFSGRYGKLLACDYLFFAHMLWATVAVAVNNPNRVIENVGSSAVEFLGGYLLARAYIRTPDQFQTLVKILLWMIILSLPLAMVESITGRAVIPHLIESIPGLGTVKQVNIGKRMGLFRVQNAFAHPIHYGLFCSTAFALTLVGLKDQMGSFRRLFSALLICLGVFLSLSSGALLAIILQAGLLTWAFVFRKVRNRWLLLLGLFGLAYVTVDLLSNRTPTKVFMSYATFSSQTAYYRSIIFDWGMRNVWANPVFGLGLRTWLRPAYMKSGSVDNFWLVMAMKYGIPGFILVTLGYFQGLFKVGLRDLTFSDRVSRLRLAWMITFAGLSFTLTTVHVWTSIYSFTFFFFGAGLWMANYSEAEGDSREGGDVEKRTRELRYRRSFAAKELPQKSNGPMLSRSREELNASELRTRPQTENEVRYTRFPRK